MMSRGRNISPEQRAQIQLLRNEGLTFRQIGDRLGISSNACCQAVKHVEVHGTTRNKTRVPKARKTSVRVDRMIHRISEADRHKTAVDVHAEISNSTDVNISVRTVRRRLNEFGLMGRVARHKPLVSEKNLRERMAFARAHIDWTPEQWSKVVFTDESKFNRFGSDGKSYVRRRVGEEFTPKCTKPTVKGGGGSVMVWGAMSMNGTGPIQRIEGTMDQYVYVNLLENALLPFAKDRMPEDWVFQADNDPKHTSRLAKQFLVDHNVNVMKWPAQSPDLNPIEMLWLDVEKHVKIMKPKNLTNLYEVIRDGWRKIPTDRCIRLIQSMSRRCAEVIKRKGGPTKY